MAFNIIGEFILKGTDKAVQQFNSVSKSTKTLNAELKNNRDAVGLLDKVTGGAVSQFMTLQKQLVGGAKALKVATGGFKLLKVAMLSSGIGAIAVLVGAMAANWEKITGLLKGASLESQNLAATTQALAEAEQEKLDSLNGQENILKLQGKSEKEILQLKAKQTQETINALEASVTAQQEVKRQQVETAKRNQTILSGILKFVSAPLTLVLAAYDKITGSNTMKVFDDAASLLFDPEATAEDANEQLEKTQKQLDSLKNSYAGYQLSIDKIDKDAKDKRDANKQKEIDDALKAEEQRLQGIQNLRDKYTKLNEDREDQTFLEKAERQKERALAELDALNATEEQKAEAIAYYDGLILDAKKKDQDVIDQMREKDKKDEQELADKKLEIKEKAFEDAAKLFGEESRLGKAIYAAKQILTFKENLLEAKKTFVKGQEAVKQATIDGAKSGTAISQGTAETAKIGFPQNIPLLVAYAAQAVGIVSAIKGAVGKVKQTVGGGVSAPEIETPSVPTSTAPAFNIVGASGTNQLADAIAQSGQQPVRSYVVSNDVTTAQELERNIISGASIG